MTRYEARTFESVAVFSLALANYAREGWSPLHVFAFGGMIVAVFSRFEYPL